MQQHQQLMQSDSRLAAIHSYWRRCGC